MFDGTAHGCKIGTWWLRPVLFSQIILNNKDKKNVLRSYIHLIDKISPLQCRKVVFEKGVSLTFTGCGCTCLAVSILPYVRNSSSMLDDYFLRGNFNGSRKWCTLRPRRAYFLDREGGKCSSGHVTEP